jgi:hypothetical protein
VPGGADAEKLYGRLETIAGPLMKARLEEGALLAAGLITVAWVEAGRPDPSRWNPPAVSRAATSPGSASPAAASPSTGFVGSKNSDTFHRAKCTHVRRIKPENLLRFEAPSEAMKAGRKPCKSCKPDQP